MDDKVFDMLEKIYIEVQSHGNRLNVIENEVKKISSLENEIKKVGMQIDGKVIPTSEALLDGYKGNSENITIIDDKIDRLQIDVNSITMKVSYNDSRIIEISKDLRKVK